MGTKPIIIKGMYSIYISYYTTKIYGPVLDMMVLITYAYPLSFQVEELNKVVTVKPLKEKTKIWFSRPIIA